MKRDDRRDAAGPAPRDDHPFDHAGVGISIVQALLTHGMAQANANLATTVAAGNQGLLALPQALGPDTPTGLAVIAAEVQRQAALIGYVNDFWTMMAITVLPIPLLVLMRAPRRGPAQGSGEVPH